MADPLTGVLVSGFAKVVLEKLGSKAFESLAQIYGVKSEFGKLKKTLKAFNAALEDSEQQHGNKAIRNWIVNIKDVVYDIEDLLDMVSIEALERKVNEKSIGRLLIGPYSRYSLAQEVTKICNQLSEIKEIRQISNPGGSQSDHHLVKNSIQHRETISFIKETEIFGRQEDQEWIVSRLVGIEQSIVLPMVGMGGIGKTTLAKLVFNDPKLDTKFDVRLWVYVSKKIDLTTVIRNIIQSATRKSFLDLDFESLQKELRHILKDRTFLLVLDDVWIYDRSLWLQLKNILFAGLGKSAIIVSTREEKVAHTTKTTEFHRLKDLSEDHSWSLFVTSAFSKDEEKSYPNLVKIGKSIVKKCQGNPLALKTLGSVLWTKRDVYDWKKLQMSEIWNIEDEGNDILLVLKVSFDYMPYHLKSCFTYCAIFGKGYPMLRSDLINVWMAQGLLEDKDGRMEGKGDECVDQLLSSSFFRFPEYDVTKRYVMEAAGVFNCHQDWANFAQSFNNNMIDNVDMIEKHFKDYRGKLHFVEMHDLMQDLATYVAGEEIANVSSSKGEISERARHIVWDKEDLSEKEFPKDLMKARKVRTSAFLHPMGSLSKSFLESLLSSFKCLRVLMLLNSEFEELPDLIGDLKHLRYIDVCRNNKLQGLPNVICNLVKLQTLDFSNCNELSKLPKDMHKLVSLRSLIVTTKATCLPNKGFQCCSSLRVLKIIKCPALTSLPKGMGSLKSLRVFVVEFCSSLASLPDEMNQLTNLEELSIGYCQQLELTQWDGLIGLTNLMFLRLYGIPKLVDFPKGINSSSALRLLRIGRCEALKSLPEGLELCTSLVNLQVCYCGELSRLPVGVQSLGNLQELTIKGCSVLRERCERETGDDWNLISHIPYIQFDHQVQSSFNSRMTAEYVTPYSDFAFSKHCKRTFFFSILVNCNHSLVFCSTNGVCNVLNNSSLSFFEYKTFHCCLFGRIKYQQGKNNNHM